MGSVRRRGKSWHAEVRHRKPAFYAASSWPTKALAEEWKAKKEAEYHAGRLGKAPPRPFRDALTRYAAEVSPTKAGARWEALRLALIGRDPIGDVMLPELGPGHFAAWRDRRLQAVSGGSVLREMTLLRHVITVAMAEWGWLPANPMTGVRRPKKPPSRDRLPTCEEVERILYCLGFEVDAPALSVGQRVAVAWLLAVETAMRASELCGLTPDRIHLEARYARLYRTKNGLARDVALSPCATWLLGMLPGGTLNLSPSQIDSNWRKAVKAAQVVDLHFHDSRALAITRLSKKLDILTLARMVGHRNLNQLQTYYRETAQEMAGKL